MNLPDFVMIYGVAAHYQPVPAPREFFEDIRKVDVDVNGLIADLQPWKLDIPTTVPRPVLRPFKSRFRTRTR